MRRIPAFTISWLFACCFVTIFSSCSNTPYHSLQQPYLVGESRQKQNRYYIPSAPNVPLLKKKHDLSASIQLSSSIEPFSKSYNNKKTVLGEGDYSWKKVLSTKLGGEWQFAYMPVKHIGIMASYSLGASKSPEINHRYGNIPYGSDTIYTYKAHKDLNFKRFEMGVGYVLPINKKWHFETYTGYGWSKTDNLLHTGRISLKNNYLFLQPVIAFELNGPKNTTIQWAFISKFIRNDFNVANTSFDKDREPVTSSQVKLLEDHPIRFFWEPGIVFRAGRQNIQFHGSYSYSTGLSARKLQSGNQNFSFGMYLKFNAKK